MLINPWIARPATINAVLYLTTEAKCRWFAVRHIICDVCKQSFSTVNGDTSEAARSSGNHRVTSPSSSSLYEVELHRGSRGFGFAIRGGSEFVGMPICVLNIASGGSADRDGRLRVGYMSRIIYSHYM